MSKAEQKQARREMAAAARRGAPKGGGFDGLARAEREGAWSGRWLTRERAWEESERKGRQQVSWFIAAGLALPVLYLAKVVLMDPMGYTPSQTLMAQVSCAALVALIPVTLWRARAAVQNPLVAVWEGRRAEVVWAYVNDHTTLVAGTSFKHRSATLALADGTSVATQTPLEAGDFEEIVAGLPSAVVGYTDARRDAFVRDPRSVQ